MGVAVRTDQTHRVSKIGFARTNPHDSARFQPFVTVRAFHSKYLSGIQYVATRGLLGKYRRHDESAHKLIELANAAFSYGGTEILTDVNLGLTPGSFHFLTGPSGSGKTTLLRLCFMELLPSAGQVNIFGRDVRSMTRDEVAEARRRIGVVHQDCKFLDHLSIADNIALPLDVSGRDTEAERANLDELLAWVGLSHRALALPAQLSGGERQRAALARAVIMSPDVIIADEPTGNIDWEMAQRLLRLLIELNRMGKTVLIATHDLNLIRSAKAHVSARVLRLHQRRLQAAGAEL